MKNIKQKIIWYLYKINPSFFLKDIQQYLSKKLLDNLEEKSIESLYDKHREKFEQLLVRDFVGFIPKDVNEPALKIFEDHAESFQKWILWQSYYINRKALHDPLHIPKYDGMMIYLKVMHLMAEANKKKWVAPVIQNNTEVEIPWIDKVLQDLEDVKKAYENRKTNPVEGTEDIKSTKVNRTKGKNSKDA